MRTVDECLTKAIEMERHAAHDGPATRADWLGMAAHWRNLAHDALWQDRCGAIASSGDRPG